MPWPSANCTKHNLPECFSESNRHNYAHINKWKRFWEQYPCEFHAEIGFGAQKNLGAKPNFYSATIIIVQRRESKIQIGKLIGLYQKKLTTELQLEWQQPLGNNGKKIFCRRKLTF